MTMKMLSLVVSCASVMGNANAHDVPVVVGQPVEVRYTKLCRDSTYGVGGFIDKRAHMRETMGAVSKAALGVESGLWYIHSGGRYSDWWSGQMSRPDKEMKDFIKSFSDDPCGGGAYALGMFDGLFGRLIVDREQWSTFTSSLIPLLEEINPPHLDKLKNVIHSKPQIEFGTLNQFRAYIQDCGWGWNEYKWCGL